jgi:ABC-type multidrug transport system fused ATPase/permease subunit
MIDGQISEKGSHVSLMEQDGWYAKMFRMQQDEVDTL